MATTFLQVKNRAVSALAADITSTATSLTVTAGEGAKFPAPGNGFHITIEDEILKCTARSTDTLTVVRAQEGTTGVAHTAGKSVELRITAGVIESRTTWEVDKLLKGAGAGADPTEIDDYIQGARVYNSANLSIPNNTETALALDSEGYDTDTIHDTVTNNSRLTCKTAGKYLIIAQAWWAGNSTGFRAVTIKLNGATVLAQVLREPVGTYQCRMITTTIYDLAVDDYVEVTVTQTSGAALNVFVAGYASPEFMMQRVG